MTEHDPGVIDATTDIVPGAKAEPSKKGGGFFKELPILILIAFGLALVIKTFLVQAFFIPSESMVPTLEIGDRVMVNKLVTRFREPRRGEIIVFIADRDERVRSFGQKVRSFLFEGLGVTTPRERDFIKRVIGLPGETVEMRKAKVTVTRTDGTKVTLDEPYLAEELDQTPFKPFTVPADMYFVMGDNRPNSSDSRSTLGPIARSDIVGKAFIRIWPAGRFGFFHRPAYETVAAGALIAPFPLVFGAAAWRRRRRAA